MCAAERSFTPSSYVAFTAQRPSSSTLCYHSLSVVVVVVFFDLVANYGLFFYVVMPLQLTLFKADADGSFSNCYLRLCLRGETTEPHYGLEVTEGDGLQPGKTG